MSKIKLQQHTKKDLSNTDLPRCKEPYSLDCKQGKQLNPSAPYVNIMHRFNFKLNLHEGHNQSYGTTKRVRVNNTPVADTTAKC